jgi:hypothetical protein
MAVSPAGVGDSAAQPRRAATAPKVVSYFRVDAGWTELWRDWRPEAVARDLRRVASLRADTVRAIVSPGQFGYPRPSATYTRRLQEFVALAAASGLRVQLTLFDWWYEWEDLRGSRTWARALLAPYAGDRRIASVELKNELVVQPHVVAWARAMIPFVRGLVGPAAPVTLSVSGRNPVGQLSRLKRGLGGVRPDAFDVHYFGGGGELAFHVLTRAKAIAAPTPLRVGETGYPTTTALTGFGGVPRTRPAQEAAQAHFLAALAWGARAAGVSPPGVWLLDDLRPEAVPDRRVSESDPDLHFGLFRTDGTAKPAAAVVRSAFSNRTRFPFNAGFERAVAAEEGPDVPAEWSMQGAHVAFAVDPDVAKEGRASARITPDGTGAGSFAITPADGGLQGGERVTVDAWARRAAPGGRVLVAIEWLDPSGRTLGRAASAPLPAVTTWRRLRAVGRAPRRAAYLRIALVADAVTRPVWFDAVRFARPAIARG